MTVGKRRLPVAQKTTATTDFAKKSDFLAEMVKRGGIYGTQLLSRQPN